MTDSILLLITVSIHVIHSIRTLEVEREMNQNVAQFLLFIVLSAITASWIFGALKVIDNIEIITETENLPIIDFMFFISMIATVSGWIFWIIWIDNLNKKTK